MTSQSARHRWIILVVALIHINIPCLSAADATPAAAVNTLKLSLNQLVRQQNTQTNRFQSQLGSAAMNEMSAATFALSEVFFNCQLMWLGLQSQFLSVGDECAIENSPHTLDSLARDVEADLTQCVLEVEENFRAVTDSIELSLSAELVESSKLNFWLQSKLFAGSSLNSGAAMQRSLAKFDAVTTAREIFQKAVLWDNVGSIKLYRSIQSVPGPLTSAGEWGFICGQTSFNRLFGKIKAVEAFLNTNCATAAVSGDDGGATAVSFGRDSTAAKRSFPEATVKLLSGFSEA